VALQVPTSKANRFQVGFCPPAARRNTGSDQESEKLDKVCSVLGVSYKPDLHYALGHMRRWDGAYSLLANGAKAVDLLMTEEGKARSIIIACQCGFEHEHNHCTCSGMRCAKATVCTGTGFTTRFLRNCSPDSQREVSFRDRCHNR
jgi:hypothetical protein